MKQYSIFVVFSSTPYFIGKMIRRITGETYNHVSIALDADLSRMYSFARRYYRTPFYGGFVRESHSRYHVNGKNTDICLCRLPVTGRQYETLEALLTQMCNNKEQYIYNHLSAMGALFHKRIKAKDAYTCTEFCVPILHSLGIDLDPDQYYSVGDVERLLRPFAIYTGPMPASGEYDTVYYAKKPIPHPILTTLRDICKLIPRLKMQ